MGTRMAASDPSFVLELPRRGQGGGEVHWAVIERLWGSDDRGGLSCGGDSGYRVNEYRGEGRGPFNFRDDKLHLLVKGGHPIYT